MKITTKWNYKPEAGRTFTQPSQTVPDMTMSIREIISRYTRGLPISGNRLPPQYDGPDYEGLNLDHLDPVDRAEYIESELSKVKNRTQAEEKARKSKEKAEKEAFLEAEVAKRLAAKASPEISTQS